MATEAFPPARRTPSVPSVPISRVVRPINRTRERIFFAGMAILLSVVVVVGFSRTYFLVGMVRAPLPNGLVHVHGAAFTFWMVLYLTQSALISAKRVAWHRSLGTIAYCLPPIMVVLGLIAAIDGLRRGVTIGPLDVLTSSAISLLGMPVFAIVIFASWRARRRPDAHKRLVLFATIGLCEAALGRFPWSHMGLSPAAGAVVSLGVLLLFPLTYDLIALHRIHRSSMWAAPLTFVIGAASVPIGMTPAWHAVAGFLARYVAPHV